MKISDEKKIKELEKKFERIEISSQLKDNVTDTQIKAEITRRCENLTVADLMYAITGIERPVPVNVKTTQADIAKAIGSINPQLVNNFIIPYEHNLSPEKIVKHREVYCRFPTVTANNKSRLLIVDLSGALEDRLLPTLLQKHIERTVNDGLAIIKEDGTWTWNDELYDKMKNRNVGKIPHKEDFGAWMKISEAIRRINKKKGK